MEITPEIAVGIVTAMSTAIGILYRQQTKDKERLEKKLDGSERRILDLTNKVGKLEGMETMTQRVEKAVLNVIEEVKKDA